ncbi:MAG: neutral/alkaline non-lysosomal ceramidase N-terminal domain-containing protein [Verrucomicrobia bacterium]|nr:neutral/alkaline non-lysosomal ceramidase N-terminal domain-containing protein [Verrucomicrobiota bacterium]
MKTNSLLQRFLSLLVIIMTAEISNAAEFKAAAARTDITPPLEYKLWGYSDRKSGATAVLDPLFARVLVLDDGSNRLALITLDLGRPFGPPFRETLLARVKRSAGVHQVFLMASHTHSGPVIDDSYPEGKIPPWETEANDKIARAIEEASGRLVAARIGTGYGQTSIGHNRRYVQADGSVKMLWRNATKIPTSPVDPSVGIIRVDDASGKPLAILVNYSCHPVVFGPDNLRYSADYPGAMAKFVEESFDKSPICFFLQAAPGDINPYFDKTPLNEDADRLMKETGEQVGKEAVRVAHSITTKAPDKPSLKYSLDTMKFDLRWDAEKVMALVEKRVDATTAGYYRRSLVSPIPCPVMTVLINDEIALMGMPGEPFVEFAMDFRARSPVPAAFFVGYANGYYAYFPTIKAAVEGGYGANSLTTRTEVGAGEAMVDHAIVKLYQMLGKLTPVPSP